MSRIPDDLRAAYRAAVYEIDTGGGAAVEARIGRPCDALETLLRERGARTGVFITAYNPHSRRLGAAENTDAHRALLDAVAGLGNDFLPSRGRDPHGTWPAEPGLFIFDLKQADADALARRFDQYAYVRVTAGRAPELVCME